MKLHSLLRSAALGACGAMAIVAAHAADLTTEQATNFAGTLAGITDIALALEEKGATEVFDEDEMFTADGVFQPYSGGLAKLKADYPGEYSALTKLAKQNNFKNAADWATAADATMLAYMSHKVPPMDAAAMSMPDEMLKMLPPDTLAQYKKAQVIMKALASVPQADKDAVAPVIPALDAAFAAQAQKAGAFEGLDDLMKGGMQ